MLHNMIDDKLHSMLYSMFGYTSWVGKNFIIFERKNLVHTTLHKISIFVGKTLLPLFP